MPWSRQDIVSIQLGALKAYLMQEGFCVDTRHYYKDIVGFIGSECYRDISLNGLCDVVFSPLYSSHLKSNVDEYIRRFLGSNFDYDSLLDKLHSFIDAIMDDIDWGEYTNIAFTTSLVQFIPSLYLARKIKSIHPSVNIIFGGASLVGTVANKVLELFTDIDFVIKGEGEHTLTSLLKYVEAHNLSYFEIDGLVFRDELNRIVSNKERALICDLNSLPAPDFDDYFNFALAERGTSFPILTVESSRGCFWGDCSFCNLNIQWNNSYREKDADKVLHEIITQSSKYKVLDFFFTDSNVSNKRGLFKLLKEQNRDYIFYAEVSGHLSREDFADMHSAGVRDIQIGIESFDSSLLKKFNKGVTVMRNIEMLKWCCEFGIELFYNVISGFPNTIQHEADNTLANMKYAQYFHPPVVTEYCLSIESEVYRNYLKYNIDSWKVPDEYRLLYDNIFLEETAPLLNSIVGYEAVLKNNEQINWNNVIIFSEYWRKTFDLNKGKSALTWYDGGEFITIKKILCDYTESYTLSGIAKDIYVFCLDESKSFHEIVEKLGDENSDVISKCIQDMYELQIMFVEDNLCFSLALKCK